MLYKIDQWLHTGNVSIFNNKEFNIIKESCYEALEYLDEDEFHTYLGADPEEVYKVRDITMSIEVV